MLKRLLLKKSIFSLTYLIAALAVEAVFFLCVGLGVGPSYFGINLLFALGFALLLYALPSFTGEAVCSLLLLLVQIGVSCINEALLRMSGMVFSLNMLNLAKEVGGVFTSDFINWGLFYGFLLFWGGLAFFYGYLLRRVPAEKGARKTQWVLFLAFVLFAQNTFALSVFGTNAFLKASFSHKNEDYTLWTTQYNTKKTYKKFGYFGFYYQNFGLFFDSILEGKPSEPEIEENISALDYYFAAGEMSQKGYDSAYTGALKGKNIVLVVMESGEWYGINEEYTPTLYAMASQGLSMTQFYARDKTNHSEALSILGSYPVTRSIAPSIGDAEGLLENTFSFTLPNILNENGYSTHYFHANEGDFYSRRDAFTPLYGFEKSYFLEDMPALKGSAGKDSFYDFDKDSELIKNYAEEYTEVSEGDSNFFTMQMSLISHGNYEDLVRLGDYKYLSDEEKRGFSEKCTVKGLEEYYLLIDGYPQTFVENTPSLRADNENLSRLTETEYAETYLRYKRYQAGLTDLDVGINALVNKLQRENKLKDTAFIFYADHSSYYNNLNYLLKDVSFAEGYDTTLYNIPFFIWSGESMSLQTGSLPVEGYESVSFAGKTSRFGLKSGQIDKFCNTFDVLPTLLHLQGYSYNKNLYHGESVFSRESSVFVSRESGIMWDNVYYDGITFYVKDEESGQVVPYDYEAYLLSEEKVDAVESFIPRVSAYYERQSYLEMMYESDYFATRDLINGFPMPNGNTIRYLERI